MILNGDGNITGLAAGGLPDSSVTTAELADGAVTTLKITDANVTTAKIADANVTTAKIADGAITSAKILDGTIATADIADSAITTAKIANANVTVAKLSATGTPSSTTYLRGDGTWGTPAGGVTSITAGSGLTGGTITTTGTIALDVYNGTTVNNSSYPIGTYVVTNGVTYGDTSFRNVNTAYTVYSPQSGAGSQSNATFSAISSSGTGSTALAGTWRARGMSTTPLGCAAYYNYLYQRTA